MKQTTMEQQVLGGASGRAALPAMVMCVVEAPGADELLPIEQTRTGACTLTSLLSVDVVSYLADHGRRVSASTTTRTARSEVSEGLGVSREYAGTATGTAATCRGLRHVPLGLIQVDVWIGARDAEDGEEDSPTEGHRQAA